MRGTFANIRLRNQLAPGTEGGVTRHLPDGEQMSIYDAAMRYAEEGVPLVVLGGKEYGSGSSRDWAAKGTLLLGVRAVIAESFERIHRSNLVGMGVLPLQFADGESAESLGLDRRGGVRDHRRRGTAQRRASCRARRPCARARSEFTVRVRIDTPTRGRVLPPRRHPAVRAQAAVEARRGLGLGEPVTPSSPARRCGSPVVRPLRRSWPVLRSLRCCRR